MSDKNNHALKLLPLTRGLRAYHRHEVVGMSEFPRAGGALVVANHSLATYDIMLLMAAIYRETGRIPRPLIDRAFFKFPLLGDIMEYMGSMEGSRESAQKLLLEDEIVTVAPGGMREALKPSNQRYQIHWAKRKGFAKMAIKTQKPIVLAACPKADDIYDVYENKITPWIYKNFKLPFFIARGVGPTPLPKPVKLVHFLSKPLAPPESEADLEDFHQMLINEMKSLITQAVFYKY